MTRSNYNHDCVSFLLLALRHKQVKPPLKRPHVFIRASHQVWSRQMEAQLPADVELHQHEKLESKLLEG